MNIKLYYWPHTRAFRVRWLLEELQLPYKLEYINLFKGETNSEAYKTVHPLGYLPAIEVDDRTMFESGAICAWLSDKFPQKKLAPDINAQDRSDYEQWMYFVPGEVEPPIFFYRLHDHILPEKQQARDILPWLMERYTHVLKTLDKKLKTQKYLLGDNFSTPDIMLGSTISWLPEKLKPFTALEDYLGRLTTRMAYINASKQNN